MARHPLHALLQICLFLFCNCNQYWTTSAVLFCFFWSKSKHICTLQVSVSNAVPLAKYESTNTGKNRLNHHWWRLKWLFFTVGECLHWYFTIYRNRISVINIMKSKTAIYFACGSPNIFPAWVDDVFKKLNCVCRTLPFFGFSISPSSRKKIKWLGAPIDLFFWRSGDKYCVKKAY